MMQPRIRRRDTSVLDDGWPGHIHPVLRRIFAGRGMQGPADIDHRLAGLAAPLLMGGMQVACELLAAALADDRRIVVVGDFDADGATGTAVAVRGLRLLGGRNIGFRVPNRALHGYGLSEALVDTLRAPEPELIITVDNGVASHAGVAAARARGIDVLITDHHLPGDTLPAANAIVNPNLHGDPFPSKTLAGVGVMFCLLVALRAHLRGLDWYTRRGVGEPDLRSLLDLVALGTVADLVALDRNNRILVDSGLQRIRAGQASAGVMALIEASGRDHTRLVSSDFAFALAPRINAAGRLEDMALGIECLITDDLANARRLAELLSGINDERRGVQTVMMEQADALVDRWVEQRGDAALPVGLCLFEHDWHPGVVGLVASKIKERLHRPTVACAPAEQGSDEIRGSARSIAGFHVRDALAEIDARHPGMIVRFGGHAMAAGLTLQRAQLDAFSQAFNAVASERLAAEQLQAVLLSDGELAATDLGLDLARLLRYGAPWGQGFAEPLFDNEFEVLSSRVIGLRHLRLQLRLQPGAAPIEAILFNADLEQPVAPRIRAAYQLDVNEWNGRESAQLILRHIEPA
ncbi:MAG: single-stranded-DNA-specific exonuclease RecJ [Dokdonella sp.]